LVEDNNLAYCWKYARRTEREKIEKIVEIKTVPLDTDCPTL
jgi:hypothetical protein